MKLTELLKKFKEDPENLEDLAKAITMAEKLEQGEQEFTDKVLKLQKTNRELLQMVPVPEVPKAKNEEEQQPTIDDAVAEIKKTLGGNE